MGQCEVENQLKKTNSVSPGLPFLKRLTRGLELRVGNFPNAQRRLQVLQCFFSISRIRIDECQLVVRFGAEGLDS